MHRVRFVLLSLLIAASGLAMAQDTIRLSTVDGADWGVHVVVGEGMSVYLYEPDEGGAIACVDACTNNWPPVIADSDITVGEELDRGLVDTVERPDGTSQVTYGGHPLYTYVRDAEAGDANGQGLGGAFFLLSPGGDAVVERAAREPVGMDAELFEELMTAGETNFAAQCAVCHAADGTGKIGPSLHENDLLGDTGFLAGRILNGFRAHGMPPFRDQLTDREIAAVATFVRNSWGNDFGGVFEEEVTELR